MLFSTVAVTNLYSHQCLRNVLFFSSSSPAFIVGKVLKMTIMTGGRLYLHVFLIFISFMIDIESFYFFFCNVFVSNFPTEIGFLKSCLVWNSYGITYYRPLIRAGVIYMHTVVLNNVTFSIISKAVVT